MKSKRKMEIVIVNWLENFTNAQSRKMVALPWLPIPTKQGEHYCAMMAERNGAEIYGVWIALVIMASKCPVRGRLIKANKEPHDFRSISLQTRVSERVLKKSVEWLDQNTDWIEVREWSGMEENETQHDGMTIDSQPNEAGGTIDSQPNDMGGGIDSQPGEVVGALGDRLGDIEHREEHGDNMEKNSKRALSIKGIPRKGEHSPSDVFSRVKGLKSSGGWYVETEQSLVATAQEVFGKEWQGIGGWRRRFREDPGRVKKCWGQFAADVGEGKAIKNPGGYLNDLWKRFPASKESAGKEAA